MRQNTAPAKPDTYKLDTPQDFALFTNVTAQTVRNWLRRGIIKPTICNGRIVRFDRAEALAALNANAGGAH